VLHFVLETAIAKLFAQTPRGLAALRKYFLHIERKAV
jgi:hypothetical protein